MLIKIMFMNPLFRLRNLLLGFVTVVAGCTASQKASKDIRGTWILKSVITEGILNKPNVIFFNEVNFSCFIGSEWKFGKNGKRSMFTIADQQKECTVTTNLFTWKYTNSGSPAIYFNRVERSGKVLDRETGIQYLLTESTPTSMKLRQEVSINGQSGALIYNFVK